MNALVEQLAAAGDLGLRPPLLVVPDASAVAVAAADEHQRTELPGGEHLARLLKRGVVAVVEADLHAHAAAFGGGDRARSSSSGARAAGFSTSTCLPASTAASVTGASASLLVDTNTASTSACSTAACQSATATAPRACAASAWRARQHRVRDDDDLIVRAQRAQALPPDQPAADDGDLRVIVESSSALDETQAISRAGTAASGAGLSRMESFGAQPKPRISRAVEEDERAVADPAAVAAGVGEARVHAELLRDPADRVVDLAVLVRAEVEDLSSAARALDRGRRSRRCSPGRRGTTSAACRCRARAARGGRATALVEVEHVAVRVALAEDGDEPEDAGLEAEAVAVGAEISPSPASFDAP